MGPVLADTLAFDAFVYAVTGDALLARAPRVVYGHAFTARLSPVVQGARMRFVVRATNFAGGQVTVTSDGVVSDASVPDLSTIAFTPSPTNGLFVFNPYLCRPLKNTTI